jgi:hypothetical protein
VKGRVEDSTKTGDDDDSPKISCRSSRTCCALAKRRWMIKQRSEQESGMKNPAVAGSSL